MQFDVFGLMRASIDIEADAEPVKILTLLTVVSRGEFRRSRVFLTGGNFDGHAIVVAAADEANIVAIRTEITHVDVCWQLSTGDVADVQSSVGIRQSGGNEESALWHGMRHPCFVGVVTLVNDATTDILG